MSKLACYGFRPFMDDNPDNHCDNHHHCATKVGLCYYSNWPVRSI